MAARIVRFASKPLPAPVAPDTPTQMIKRACWAGMTVGKHLAAAICVAVVSVLGAKEMAAAEIPVVDSPPSLDGRLDDPCWGKADAFTDFRVTKPTGASIPPTKVRLLRDAAWLYAGFECDHPAMGSLEQGIFTRDGEVKRDRDESVEILLMGPENISYRFILSFANVQSERRITGTGQDVGWMIPWRSATAVRADGWSAEIAIPLFILADGKNAKSTPPARWGATRDYVEVTLDAMGAKMNERRVFGVTPARGIPGLDQSPLAIPFLPSVEKVEVSPYRITSSGKSYEVTAAIHSHSETGGEADLVVLDSPAEGGPQQAVVKAFNSAGKEFATVSVAVPVSTMGGRKVSVQLRLRGQEDAIQRMAVDDVSALSPMANPYCERNYYTAETEALLRCGVNLPPESLEGCVMRVSCETAALGVKDVKAAAELAVAIPLAGVALGTHSLKVALIGKDNSTLSEKTAVLVKRPPKPGLEVKIDRFRQTTLVNGQPFVPFGVFGHNLESGDHEYFRHLAETGFNTVIRVGRYKNAAIWPMEALKAETEKYYAETRRHGLMVVDWPTDLQPWPANLDKDKKPIKGLGQKEDLVRQKEIFDAYALRLGMLAEIQKEQPNFLAYYNVDEPNLLNYYARVAVAEWYYKLVGQLDGYHPVLLLYAQMFPKEDNATRWGDVLAFNPYLMTSLGSLTQGRPNLMSKRVSELKARCDSERKPAWIAPIAEQLDPQRSPRALSPREQLCQTYLAMIHGATGFLYFADVHIYSDGMWGAFKKLAAQIKVLTPCLTSPPAPQTVSCLPVEWLPERGRFPVVQSRLFYDPSGKHWVLLSANGEPVAVDVSYTIEGLPDSTEVADLFGDAAFPVARGAFKDSLEGYGVRAYRLRMPPPGANPVAMTVTAVPHPERTIPEGTFEFQSTQGRRNLILNPSFKRTTVPNIPDYFRPTRWLGWPPAGAPGSAWALDSDAPQDGCHSVRVKYQGGKDRTDREYKNALWGVAWLPRQKDRKAPYVLSVYLRGARDGDKVSARLGDTINKTWTTTTQWQRYSVSGDLAENGPVNIYITPEGDGAEVWVSALQVEAGTEPTPFVDK